MKRKIKPGDVCQLQSGGPLLTVSHETADGTMQCHWFNPVRLPTDAGDDLSFDPRVYTGCFPRAALERVDFSEVNPNLDTTASG